MRRGLRPVVLLKLLVVPGLAVSACSARGLPCSMLRLASSCMGEKGGHPMAMHVETAASPGPQPAHDAWSMQAAGSAQLWQMQVHGRWLFWSRSSILRFSWRLTGPADRGAQAKVCCRCCRTI